MKIGSNPTPPFAVMSIGLRKTPAGSTGAAFAAPADGAASTIATSASATRPMNSLRDFITASPLRSVVGALDAVQPARVLAGDLLQRHLRQSWLLRQQDRALRKLA